jgi:hypothetical protein
MKLSLGLCALFAVSVPAVAYAAATPAPRVQTQSRPVQQPPQQVRPQQQVIRQPYQVQQQPVRQPYQLQQQPVRQPYQGPQQQMVRPYQVQQGTRQPYQMQERTTGVTPSSAAVYRPVQTQTRMQNETPSHNVSKGEITEGRYNPTPAYGERNVHGAQATEHRYEPGVVHQPGSHPEAIEHRVPTEVHVIRPERERERVDTVVHRARFDHRVVGLRAGRIRDARVYRSIRAYHYERYHTVVVTRYINHPELYHGYWHDGWYDGYWHSYWANEPWTWFNGNYGFWFDNGGVSTFVYEESPGVCSYWNGAGWMPWYDPPLSPYPCPY